MSRFGKMTAIGVGYAVLVGVFVSFALDYASSGAAMLAMRHGGADGIFLMYGMAFIGMSVVASVIVAFVAREAGE